METSKLLAHLISLGLTPGSSAFLVKLFQDAPNWSGQPMLDFVTPADKGNITDLKRKKLISTNVEEGCTFVWFHDEARSIAAAFGIDLGIF